MYLKRRSSPLIDLKCYLTLISILLGLIYFLIFLFSTLQTQQNLALTTSNSISGINSLSPPTSSSTSNNNNNNNNPPSIIFDGELTKRYLKIHRKHYQNSADFQGLTRFFRIVHRVGLDRTSSVVLVGGTNDGQGALKILENSPSVTMHGFEIQHSHYLNAIQSLEKYTNVNMHNMGWDEEASSGKRIGGQGETAGLYDPQGQRGASLSNSTVSTVSLSDWTDENAINSTLYVLIDTEGYEAKVIRGMRLEQIRNQKRFSLFQYELGGTWAEHDSRHAGELWTQISTARYLQQKGYMLFMTGQLDWLHVNAEVFATSGSHFNPALENEGYGSFVQGNVLAMHTKFVDRRIKEAILENTVVQGKLHR